MNLIMTKPVVRVSHQRHKSGCTTKEDIQRLEISDLENRGIDLDVAKTKVLIIPPVYEVYRGYIVFAFSVRMFVCLSVCLSVNFFSVKVFSETT